MKSLLERSLQRPKTNNGAPDGGATIPVDKTTDLPSLRGGMDRHGRKYETYRQAPLPIRD